MRESYIGTAFGINAVNIQRIVMLHIIRNIGEYWYVRNEHIVTKISSIKNTKTNTLQYNTKQKTDTCGCTVQNGLATKLRSRMTRFVTHIGSIIVGRSAAAGPAAYHHAAPCPLTVPLREKERVKEWELRKKGKFTLHQEQRWKEFPTDNSRKFLRLHWKQLSNRYRQSLNLP